MQLRRLGRIGQDDERRIRQRAKLLRQRTFVRRSPQASSCASHQRARLDPAALREPQAAGGERDAGMARGFLARHVLRGTRRAGRAAARSLRGFLLVVPRKLQRSARIPAHARQMSSSAASEYEKAGARQAREHAVVRRGDRMEGAGVVAGGLHRRLGVLLVAASTSQPRAQRRSQTAAPARPAPTTVALRSFAAHRLAPRSSARRACPSCSPNPARFSTAKPATFERVPHRRGDGPGGGGGAGRGEAREGAHQRRRPHVRILRRREAVEVDRIGAAAADRAAPRCRRRTASARRPARAPARCPPGTSSGQRA